MSVNTAGFCSVCGQRVGDAQVHVCPGPPPEGYGWLTVKPIYSPRPPDYGNGVCVPARFVTEEDVRRIVREELDKRFDSTGPHVNG